MDDTQAILALLRSDRFRCTGYKITERAYRPCLPGEETGSYDQHDRCTNMVRVTRDGTYFLIEGPCVTIHGLQADSMEEHELIQRFLEREDLSSKAEQLLLFG